MVTKPKNSQNEVLSYRHSDLRKNNPEVGMVNPDTDPDDPKTIYSYDPHIDPALQFDKSRFQIEKLIDDALASGDQLIMQQTLEQLKRQQSPYLNWAGKAEKTSFDVDTVSLHVHERIDPASILSAVRKGMKKEKSSKTQVPSGQLGLFSAPFENLPLRDAIDFYKHDRGWANRLIAGDSLLVMNSLLQKESMAGQLQMMFFDPPYGIKYGSNFQAFVDKKEVKDRSDEDLTQEPEMIKAFRDTWELGIHSYLTYLRDRLFLAKELLANTGSVFIQISDENLHHVREIMDDIFGAENFVTLITFRKTNKALGSKIIGRVSDYLVWYAKDKSKMKYRDLFTEKTPDEETSSFNWVEDLKTGERRKSTPEDIESYKTQTNSDIRFFTPIPLASSGYTPSCTFPFEFNGTTVSNSVGKSWATTKTGVDRAIKLGRIFLMGQTPFWIQYLDELSTVQLENIWDDTRGELQKNYVVQTSLRVLERCMLMTTDPGDLVFDPTCGSGTTAYMAEKYGRRWITCDTSRIALTLAKQRLMTGSFDYFELKYPHEGLKGGFIYKTVPKITLGAIANTPDIDEISEKFLPQLTECIQKLSKEVSLNLEPYEIPKIYPDNWPKSGIEHFTKFHELRAAQQKLMDASITSNAGAIQLFDKPILDKKKLRISGPFTVEAVPSPMVASLDDGAPTPEADQTISRSGESQRHHDWKDELIKTGIRGKNGQLLKLIDLETLPDVKYLHASGTIAETGERVVVSFGPEYSLLEQRQVEMAMREAGELFPRPKMILFCGFDFDPEA